MTSPTAGSVRSTQPTTPWMNGKAAAVARNSRVSSRLERVWTRIAGVHPVRLQERRQVDRPERTSDRGELVGQPRVVAAAGVPEVVVGVDDHGTGASAASSPSDRSSAQSDAGMWRAIAAGYSSRWSMRRTPATSEVTAGWASGNWIAAARSGTP